MGKSGAGLEAAGCGFGCTMIGVGIGVACFHAILLLLVVCFLSLIGKDLLYRCHRGYLFLLLLLCFVVVPLWSGRMNSILLHVWASPGLPLLDVVAGVLSYVLITYVI